MGSILGAALLSACGGGGTGTGGGSGGGGGTGGGTAGFQQPAGTVAVNFSVDDTNNKVFGPGELVWKGSFGQDPTTRILNDKGWQDEATNQYAKLYDDGPWNAGGHEPAGSTANDNKWGTTVFVTPPATGDKTYEYGLKDSTLGDGWLWPSGPNGTFKVTAGNTTPITAPGITLAKFGTNDLKFELDTTMLSARPNLADGGTASWDTSKIEIKSSGWSWENVTVPLVSGKATFTLSENIGSGKKLQNIGLKNSGEFIEFLWVLNGTEYLTADGANASKMGVTVSTKAGSGSFAAVTVGYKQTTQADGGVKDEKNTRIQVP